MPGSFTRSILLELFLQEQPKAQPKLKTTDELKDVAYYEITEIFEAITMYVLQNVKVMLQE